MTFMVGSSPELVMYSTMHLGILGFTLKKIDWLAIAMLIIRSALMCILIRVI